MRTTKCICTNCKKEFLKPINEYNRRLKFGRPIYCSRRCSAVMNITNFRDKRNTIPPTRKARNSDSFLYYLKNCRRRDHEFNLTSDFLSKLWQEQKGICPYSKVTLLLNNNSKRHKDIRYSASLDRIDSSLGYVEGNVQFVSTAINYMKNTLTHQECMAFLDLITYNRSLIS